MLDFGLSIRPSKSLFSVPGRMSKNRVSRKQRERKLEKFRQMAYCLTASELI